MSQKQEGSVIPLDQKVRLKEEVHGELYRAIEERGFQRPRTPGGKKLHLTGNTIVAIANGPVGIPVEAYQRSQGSYHGRVLHARDREEAHAAREQFADVLEVKPQEEGLE